MPHSTFHSRLAKLAQSGDEGLVDHRHPPPSPLSAQIRGFIEGLGQADSLMPTKAVRQRVQVRFGLAVSIRSIEEVLQLAGLARPRARFKSKAPSAEALPTSNGASPEAQVEREELGGAGLAWLRVGSELTGYGREMAGVVSEVAQSLPEPADPIPVDRIHRDEKGQFLPEYNAPRERRDPQVGAVFESVEDKRADKDLTRLSIRTTKMETIENKLLALMASPLVSESGRFDGVTDPRGEWFQSLGTHDYMPETLSKFAREMKFAGTSQALIETHARLWYEYSEGPLGEEASAVALYVDSTSKPYWTQFFHKSGRVATVGRVMPCLETVLIHTGAGVPLYLKTFAGHVPLVKNVLPLVHEMEAAIGEGMLARLTVIDGEMNSVALFKQFDADVNPRTGEKGRYFITPLSHAQVKSLDEVQGLMHLDPYRDGDWIGGGSIDLVDPKDLKAAPYRTRVIVLERRTKQTFSAYATNAPREEYSDRVLMDAYFLRWPAQEHVFRDLNGAVAFKSVHGYGKRAVVNISVVDELTKLEGQIERTTQRAEAAKVQEREAAAYLRAVVTHHRATKDWESAEQHPQETLIHSGKERTAACGHAKAEEDLAHECVETTKLKIEKATRQHQEAREKREKLEQTLVEKRELSERLASRRTIYQTDVELDQNLSVLKLGCALIVQFLLHRFFGGLAIEFNKFLWEIFALPGARLRTPTTETIHFRANRRNPRLMAELTKACHNFNALNHRRGDRIVRLEVLWPPGSRHA